MKKIKVLAAVALLLAISAVSYQVGRNSKENVGSKDYQVACMLSDICRIMMDNLGNDAEEIYYDYVDNIDCDPEAVITKDEIRNYYWCY